MQLKIGENVVVETDLEQRLLPKVLISFKGAIVGGLQHFYMGWNTSDNVGKLALRALDDSEMLGNQKALAAELVKLGFSVEWL